MAVAMETLPNPAKAVDKDPAGQQHRRESVPGHSRTPSRVTLSQTSRSWVPRIVRGEMTSFVWFQEPSCIIRHFPEGSSIRAPEHISSPETPRAAPHVSSRSYWAVLLLSTPIIQGPDLARCTSQQEQQEGKQWQGTHSHHQRRVGDVSSP